MFTNKRHDARHGPFFLSVTITGAIFTKMMSVSGLWDMSVSITSDFLVIGNGNMSFADAYWASGPTQSTTGNHPQYALDSEPHGTKKQKKGKLLIVWIMCLLIGHTVRHDKIGTLFSDLLLFVSSLLLFLATIISSAASSSLS